MKFITLPRLGFLLVGLLFTNVARSEPEKQALAWDQTETSIGLSHRDKTVWRLVYDKTRNKSYFHPLATVDGTVLTGLRPADHVWHYATWFSWKYIDGLNYWEENPKTGKPEGITEITGVEVHPRDDFSARIEMTLGYHPPDGKEVLSEKRILEIGAPDAEGNYHIDWRSEFKAKKEKVVFDRTPLPDQSGGKRHGGYAGMSIRCAKSTVPWDFLDSEGRVNASHGKRARWLNHSGKTANGRVAGVTIFDHPENLGSPTQWHVNKTMPYFSPAVIFSNPRTLEPTETWVLRYRILVQDHQGKAEELERQYENFVKTSGGSEQGAAVTQKHSHHHASEPRSPLKKRPIPPGFEKPDHVVEIGVKEGEMRYKIEQFTVKPGDKVKLILTNTDDMDHNLLLCKPGQDVALEVANNTWKMGAEAVARNFVPEDDRVMHASRVVGVGETDEIYFIAPEREADYPYVCTLPGHALTMKGIMTVSSAKQQIQPMKPSNPRDKSKDHEVVVGERPLVYRVIVEGAAPRTISVGFPGGFNYVFNPVTCEVEFAWLGGFLNLQGERTGRGNGKNTINGTRVATGSVPFPLRAGNAGQEPKQVAFGGYRRDGKNPPVFLYEFDGVQVEQSVRAVVSESRMIYDFRIRGATQPISFHVKEREVAKVEASAGHYASGVLTVPPKDVGSFTVSVWMATSWDGNLLSTTPAPPPTSRPQPEPPQQPQPEILPAGYRVETLATPLGKDGQPLQFEGGGLDFTADGSLLFSSRLSGIWRYKDGRWSLFADGLHDPLGILVSADGKEAWVTQKPELTHLRDLDGDGQADLYRTLSDDWKFAGNYCEYVHGLVRDKKGNFYFTLNLADGGGANRSEVAVEKAGGASMGTTGGYDGWAVKVTPKNEFIPFAPGLRSPAGIGMNRDEEIFFTDNQGGWIPTSTLNHLVPDAFYGYPASLLDLPEYQAGKKLEKEEFAAKRKPAAIWIPHNELANSPGNPQFDETGGDFGPFEGQVFIGDQTRSNIFRASLEKVQGEYQGCVFNFIDHLQSGAIRIRFGPDGSLWVGQTGRGWAAVGGKMDGLQRIRWDGETIPFEMHSINLTRTGFRVRFTKPLDPETVRQPDAFRFKRWHYHYHGKYGSPKVGTQDVVPKLRSVAPDGLTVELDLPLVEGEVYQMITDGLRSTDHEKMTTTTGYYTLNRRLD